MWELAITNLLEDLAPGEDVHLILDEGKRTSLGMYFYGPEGHVKISLADLLEEGFTPDEVRELHRGLREVVTSRERLARYDEVMFA
jgi:hypothetical protein